MLLKLENQVIISLSGDDETVGGVLKIISTLTETECDDLTQDEKEQIQSALSEIEEGIEIDVATKTGFFYAILAIMAVSFTLGLPVIVIVIILYYKHRKRRQRDAVIEKFINSGKDVPADLLSKRLGDYGHSERYSAQSVMSNHLIREPSINLSYDGG